MNVKQFTVKENAGFKLSVKAWKCQAPKELNAIEFTQESKSSDPNNNMISTYQFFMTDEELTLLADKLLTLRD